MRQSFYAALAVSLLAMEASGAELPRWEAGLGAAGLSIPGYRGSDEQRGYVLPLPYIQYRGDVLRIDREGAHGDLFATERMKLDISLGAGPPARSTRNGARRGMPDIDPTVEFGPSLHAFLSRDAAGERVWSLRFPLRAVVATDFSHARSIGWVFAPHLNYDISRFAGGWEAGAGVGPLYATEAYHDYYYAVAPAYATAARPAYDAWAGYSGSRLTLTLNRRFKTFWVGAFTRYDNLSGAAFTDGPLVRKKTSFMAGAGIAWIVAESGPR